MFFQHEMSTNSTLYRFASSTLTRPQKILRNRQVNRFRATVPLAKFFHLRIVFLLLPPSRRRLYFYIHTHKKIINCINESESSGVYCNIRGAFLQIIIIICRARHKELFFFFSHDALLID